MLLRSFLRFSAIGLLVALAGCGRHGSAIAAPAPTSQPATRPTVAATEPSQSSIRIFQLSGTPDAIGQRYADQLGDDIRYLDVHYIKVFMPATGVKRIGALWLASRFRNAMRPEHRQEIEALSRALKVDPTEMTLAQCFLDISPVTACSTLTLSADAAPDHVARFGRNLDFPSLNVADKRSVILVYHPTGRKAFAAVTWPGLIGVLSGMNQDGLCLASMEVERAGRTSVSGMPYILLYRTLLENCGTVDEAITLLKQTPIETPNNLMLMDAAGHRAVAEITLNGIAVRQADDGHALMCTNHQRGHDADTPGLCDRYDTLHEKSAHAFGHIGLSDMESMLGDVAQGNFTIQSMVFEPANRVIYLATGRHATKMPYERIDLAPYLAGTAH